MAKNDDKAEETAEEQAKRIEGLIARIGSDTPPTDDELSAARKELADLLKSAANADVPNISEATALRSSIDKIDAEAKERTEKRAEAKEKAGKLLEGLEPEDDETDEDDEDETDDEADEAEDAAPAEEKVPELVAASLSAAIASTRRLGVQAKAKAPDNDEAEKRPAVTVRPMGVAQSFKIDEKSTMADVASLFSKTASGVTKGRQPLVRLEFEYPEDRRLSNNQLDATQAINKVFTEQAMGFEAMAAAGGICGPLPADFDIPICGDRARPIRDSLTRFNAAQGGVRFQPAVSLADVAAGITVWPEATDADPGEETKAVLTLDCEEEVEAKVDAIVAQVQIGNFQARFNPQFYRSRLDVLMIAHDRIAEQTLYADMVTASTAVTYAGDDGTIYSFLSAVDKAAAGIRSRLRLLPERTLRVLAPQWILNALRSDIAKQRMGGSLDALQASNQVLQNFFAVRNVMPTFSPDLDVFGTQNAGALLDYPDGSTDFLIYPEGTFMFLDGGTLDLGTEITDSTLNSTNDRQAFVETFEKAVKRGCESLKVNVPTLDACQCPDASGSV